MDPIVKITADSTCDLPSPLREELGVELLPLYVVMDGNSYRDGAEVKPAGIFAHVDATGQLPTTSAGSVGDYQDLFARLTADGSSLVHFSLSSKLSSSYQNACLAAEDFPTVRVVDTCHLSTGSGLLIVAAVEAARAGTSADGIVAMAKEMIGRVETSFLIDKLDYLRKGGRCSALVAFSANMLKLKPSINMVDGELHVGKKYRGSLSKCLRGYVQDRLQGRTDIASPLFITSTGCPEEILAQVRSLIAELQPDLTVLESVAGCTISSHCGPGTLGVLFVRK